MKICTSFVATGFCLAFVAADESRHADVKRLLATDEVAWTYRETAKNGTEPLQPADWHLAYEACAGDRQSPINLGAAYVTHADSSMCGLKFSPKSCPSNLQGFKQTDHSWKVDFTLCIDDENYVSMLEFHGHTYEFLQMHVHSTSEHTSGGGEEAGELHLVHVNTDGSGNLLVVGVKFDASSDFFNSEIVTWIVMRDYVKISETQLKTFRYAVQHYPGSTVSEEGGTNRPTMPLNGRQIYFCS